MIKNGFEQIKGFYSWVFENQDKNVRTNHIALYMFLVNQNNRNRWVEWFKCPFDLAMAGSGISNKNTYYKALTSLQDWGLIKYQKGVNNYKAPLIKIEVLFDTSTVPQSEPQLIPQLIPQSIPLPVPLLIPQLTNNIKHITSNIEPITLNIFKILDFLKTLENDGNEILNTTYTETDFLKNWATCRKTFLKVPTHIPKLETHERVNFDIAKNNFTKEQINTALLGLFKQENKNIGSMYLKPKHFLENISKYLNAEMAKQYDLYGKADEKGTKKGGL